MRKPSLPVHSLSVIKTPGVPPRGHTRILGALRPQAKHWGISEQQGAPEVVCYGPPACGHALAYYQPLTHCLVGVLEMDKGYEKENSDSKPPAMG